MMERCMLYAIVLLVCCVANYNASAASLPQSIEICKRNDDACLLRSVQKAFRTMKQGIPKLGVFPIDPLEISEMLIDKGTGPVNVKLHFRNQELRGISDVVVTETKGDFTEERFRLEIGAKATIKLLGDYTISGKVLVLPIQGDGKNNLTLENASVIFLMTGHFVEKDGKQYVHVDNAGVTFNQLKRLYIELTNLFNGNKAVGDNMNKFLNDNWEILWSEMNTSFAEAFAQVFTQIANRVYEKVPYKIIHPVL